MASSRLRGHAARARSRRPRTDASRGGVLSPPRLVQREQPLVVLAHERRAEHEVGRRAVARDRDVVDDRDAEQRLHVDIMRMWLERIPEEDHEVDLPFDNTRAHLLVPAKRSAAKASDVETELLGQKSPRGAGGEEIMRG